MPNYYCRVRLTYAVPHSDTSSALMAHSHCTELEPGMRMELEMGTMGFYILCCTVHTALR